ncbi:MAG: CHC2 zinc finger domain-containing protein [Candidatus Accumulibacter phosphatis]|uniref:CHC2 zinc finger domain-containing protein n=1 Tax=Candidatus Accumulibacter sp. ACC012 TaxID=2823332 RepID=UPI0025BCCBFA|nr:CHC2 zinc finger domain-containing protein [Candidatus Accumulibacter sp. ACC012]
MRYANPTRGLHRAAFGFKRDRLPNAVEYFREQGLKLVGGGEWKSAVCPFHQDTRPSLRVRIETGAFRCMVCGAHGGDVLAFHMQRYELRFIEAARTLGAWEEAR